MVAIGGWGDTAGFEAAAETEVTRKQFARNVRAMVDVTGADGEFEEGLIYGMPKVDSPQVLT